MTGPSTAILKPAAAQRTAPSHLYKDFSRLLADCGHDTDRLGQTYEGLISDYYRATLKPGQVAVDVGAHAGIHLWDLARQVGPKGQVFAFEPLPRLYAGLVKRIFSGGMTHVVPLCVALSDREEEAEFQIVNDAPGLSGLKGDGLGRELEGKTEILSLRTLTLDQILGTRRDVSFIKIDAEGADFNVIRGAAALMKASHPAIAFEFGHQRAANQFGFTQDMFFGFFKSQNYDLFFLNGQPYTPEAWDAHPPCWYLLAIHKQDRQSTAILGRNFKARLETMSQTAA